LARGPGGGLSHLLDAREAKKKKKGGALLLASSLERKKVKFFLSSTQKTRKSSLIASKKVRGTLTQMSRGPTSANKKGLGALWFLEKKKKTGLSQSVPFWLRHVEWNKGLEE